MNKSHQLALLGLFALVVIAVLVVLWGNVTTTTETFSIEGWLDGNNYPNEPFGGGRYEITLELPNGNDLTLVADEAMAIQLLSYHKEKVILTFDSTRTFGGRLLVGRVVTAVEPAETTTFCTEGDDKRGG